MTEHTSAAVFLLAADAGIPLTPGEQAPLEDEDFARFRERYLQWSAARDRALREHLDVTPTLFRVYLPYSRRVFGTAAQVVWYLDEIVVRDPVVTLLHSPTDSLESDKIRLRDLIQFLSRFRPWLEAGYILLHGRELVPALTDERPPVVTALLQRPEIIQSLQAATHLGAAERPDSSGRLQKVYQAQLDSGFLLKWHIVVGPRSEIETPHLIVLEKLPSVARDEFKSVLGDDFAQWEAEIFGREVHRTLWALETAFGLGSAVMYDRPLDDLIVQQAGQPVAGERQRATVGVLNVVLPYLGRVPPERLVDLREKVPSAFEDFRHRLHGVVDDVLTKEEVTPELAQAHVDRSIAPAVATLEAEMQAEIRKARILGWGGTLIASAGMLAGAAVGAPPGGVVAAGVAGALGVLKASADVEAARLRAQGRPFYFLWRARQAT